MHNNQESGATSQDEPEVLRLAVTELPPSLNDMYETFTFKGPKGKLLTKRRLSTAAADFKRNAILSMCSTIADPKNTDLIKRLSDPAAKLEVRILVSFLRLTNSGWPKKTDVLHKKVDASNRVKLVEDAVFEALGIDDSKVYRLTVEKTEAGAEGVQVWLKTMA